MIRPRSSVTLSIGAVLLLPLMVVSSCSPEAPTSPAVPIDAARAPTGPTVTSTDPPDAPQNTTLDVRVLGTGYDRGSRALWALDGDTTLAVTKVKTNTTRYVSGKELVANITIATDAQLDRYDIVAITSAGKKGIGIERFTVTPELTMTLIGPAKDGSQAEDINDAGLVVGSTGTPRRAFLWTPVQPRGTVGTLQDLGTLGSTEAYAKAINNSGHVVGGSRDAAGVGRAFLWTTTGGMQDLGLAPDWAEATALDINESGQVAGMAGTKAALWTVSVDAAGVVQVLGRESLGTLPDAGGSVSHAVNNLGQAAGWAYYPSRPSRAVLWTRTPTGWMIEDLGMLPGDHGSQAYGINDQGQVVGMSFPPQGCTHAVVWSTTDGKKTAMRALEAVDGCSVEAQSINNQGQVVGRSNTRSGPNATMWSLASDGSTASVKDLGKLSGAAGSLGIGVSAKVDGLTQLAGWNRPASGGLQATLWTVR